MKKKSPRPPKRPPSPPAVAACLIYEVRLALWEIGDHADALKADLDSLRHHLSQLETALESVRTQAEASGVWRPLQVADSFCVNLRIDLSASSRHLDRLEAVLESAAVQAEAAEATAAALEDGDGPATAQCAETAAPAASPAAAGQFIAVDMRGPRMNALRTTYGPFDSKLEALRWAYLYLRPKPFEGVVGNCAHQIAAYPPQPPTPGPK